MQGLASILPENHTDEPHQCNDDKESQNTYRDNASSAQEHLQGRIIIIEDLNKEIIELLGTSLDIDPLFFAGHLHKPWNDREAQIPHRCTLPSQAQRRDFINVHHHRIVDFNEIMLPAKHFLRCMNIDRKVVICPIARGQRIGIVQQCTSVLFSKRVLPWIGQSTIQPRQHEH
jgi:hypothetical protein